MYVIEHEPLPKEFQRAWSFAGKHLDQQSGPGLHWLRAWLKPPPVAEHLAFRMGNQIIFIFVEVDDWWTFDQERHRVFLDAAREANAVPCLMSMTSRGEAYLPVVPGWGLKHAVTGALVDPVALVSDELIEMTDWELQDFAVQVVRDQLEAEGKTLWSWQSSLQVDPSLWFEDEDGAAWVVIRAVRYPETVATPPANVDEIRRSLAQVTQRGFFAAVAVASAEQRFDMGEGGVPLYRGHGLNVRFAGLQVV